VAFTLASRSAVLMRYRHDTSNSGLEFEVTAADNEIKMPLE
jgi:hypothetical protein